VGRHVAEPPLPTFLIIGAQKSGTRWLRRNLGEHPEVFTYDGEIAYFNDDRRYRKGNDWYRTKFRRGWEGESIVGEATPGYMMWNWRLPTAEGPGERIDTEEIAARIDERLPGVQLIALLRNPVDRTYSAFIHHMLHDRIPHDADFLTTAREAAQPDSEMRIVKGSLYGRILPPYVERFGSRLLVLRHEDCFRDPEGVYRKALEHVGADPTFVPKQLTRVVNSYRPPTDSPYGDGAGGRRPLTAEERAELFTYFSDDVEQLEQLLDRDFSSWRPA
jgi:hypothetical protein